MNYPDWVPPTVVDRLGQYKQIQDAGNVWPTFQIEVDILERLASRPEMEKVWSFIINRGGEEFLTANGGLIGSIPRAIQHFNHAPHLSPADYKAEMLEIAKLAETLSVKLRKFCVAGGYNPFPFDSLLNEQQFEESYKRMGRPQDEPMKKFRFGSFLDGSLPKLNFLMKGLAIRARSESEHQTSRFGLPRKVKDENLFRTYFIKQIGNYFFNHYADYSPARLATFCSCALDDADITPTLVRKIFVLDEEMREMLSSNSRNENEED